MSGKDYKFLYWDDYKNNDMKKSNIQDLQTESWDDEEAQDVE